MLALIKKILKKITAKSTRSTIRHLLNYAKICRLYPSQFPQTRFIIFGQGRTGSQLLMDLLNAHNDIYCDSEIFHPYYYGKAFLPFVHIKSCSRQARKWRKKVYGFKVKFYQLENAQHINAYKMVHLLHKKGWKIIYLRRNNILRHSLSNLKADRNQIYHLREAGAGAANHYDKEKLRVDCAQLYNYMKGHLAFTKRERDILADTSHLELVYEEDLADSERHQQTMNKVFQFLGVEPQTVRTKYVKTSNDNLKDLIENYEEVVNYFRNTEFEYYLN